MRRLTDNVLQIGNRHFNYFVVGRQKAAIIECGVTGGVKSFEKEWQELPYQPDIQYLVAMHAHFDHICGLPALKKLFPRAEVLGSAETQKVMQKTKIMENFFYQDREMSGILLAEGILDDKPETYAPETMTLDRVIGEGDTIKLDKLSLKVINAPGHSPCGLACYLPGEEVMLLSDAGGFQISDTEIFPIFFQSYKLYIETLNRLSSFPAKILGIPHETVWMNDDVKAFYHRALEAAESAFENISRMLKAGLDEERIKQSLFTHYYKGNLRIYTPENIQICVGLLLRRVMECM